MPLTDTNKGTNSDGSLNNEYCSYCYQKGQFTQEINGVLSGNFRFPV